MASQETDKSDFNFYNLEPIPYYERRPEAWNYFFHQYYILNTFMI